MTALADYIAHGVVHTDVTKSIKSAGLTPTLQTVKDVLKRVGALPPDLQQRVEADLASSRSAPRLGLWNPTDAGPQIVDLTALAMWLHPNDAGYVRERLVALAKGPSPAVDGEPVVRSWLANPGEVINRLNALGGFGKDECLLVGSEWSETISKTGASKFACAPPDPSKKKVAPKAWEPTTSPWNGEVLAVKEYLKDHLDDPDSYEFDKCSRPARQDPFWIFDCSYRAKNKFGGLVLNAQRFYVVNGGYVGEGEVARVETLP